MSMAAVALVLLLDTPPSPAANSSPVRISSSREAELRARVNQWWAAREKRYQRAMYDLLNSEYRKNVGFQEHVAQAVQRDKYDIVAHAIREITYESPARAQVMLDYTFHAPQFGRDVTAAIRDTWVLEKGKWFKLPASDTVRFPNAPPGGPPPVAVPRPPGSVVMPPVAPTPSPSVDRPSPRPMP